MIRPALTIVLALAAATAAQANSNIDAADGVPPSVHVRYRDLDLRTADGAAKLDERIQHAARTVCTDAGLLPGRILRDRRLETRCQMAALASARPQVLAALSYANGLAGVERPIKIAAR